jgi:hypothetical protein
MDIDLEYRLNIYNVDRRRNMRAVIWSVLARERTLAGQAAFTSTEWKWMTNVCQLVSAYRNEDLGRPQ